MVENGKYSKFQGGDVKEKVSQDFLSLVVIIKQLPPEPIEIFKNDFNFFQIFLIQNPPHGFTAESISQVRQSLSAISLYILSFSIVKNSFSHKFATMLLSQNSL